MNFHPLLNFNGNCREAMLFYQSCFGGDLQLRMLSDTLNPDQLRDLGKDYVLSAKLDSQYLSLLGSDMLSELGVIEGTRVSLFCRITDGDELQRVVNKLRGSSPERGGDQWVSVTDKFGVQWVFQS